MPLFKGGVALLDHTGQIQFADEDAIEILEQPLLNQNISDVLSETSAFQAFEKALQGQTNALQLTSDWTKKPQQLALVLEPFSFAGQSGVLLQVRNMTALHRLENIEREFITNVSHELRTPLTSIGMAAESLQMGAIKDEKLRARFLSNIQRESDRLTRLVNELLILANIDETQTILNISPIDFFQVLEDVILTLKPHAEVNDIELIDDIHEGLPVILADSDRLKQVFLNLVDNGIKCNHPGGKVTLKARQEKQKVTIQVIDTGIGIPEIDLPRIFDRFFRVDKARSRVTGGTGLGLSIVKDIIEAHGGNIAVESTLNQGTTFTITLPLNAKEARSN